MTTATSTIRINKEIDIALTIAAKDFNTTRAAIVKNALVEYLQDMSDSKAIEAAKKDHHPTISHAELKARLGL